MGDLAVLALKVVLAVGIAGSLFVQFVMTPLFWADLDEAPAAVRISLVAIVFLGLVAMQVVAVCVWKLASMARQRTVFSSAAFRYVDTVVVAIGAASVLTFAMAVTLAPGEAVAPGVVLLLCGISLAIAGVALFVLVLRNLLSQAVDRDAEARFLRTELNEVI